MNFTEYWKQKQSIFERLGINRDVAHMIWCDAVDAAGREILLQQIKKL